MTVVFPSLQRGKIYSSMIIAKKLFLVRNDDADDDVNEDESNIKNITIFIYKTMNKRESEKKMNRER